MYLWRAVQFWGLLWGPKNWVIYIPAHWKLFGGGLWSRCKAMARRTFAAGEGSHCLMWNGCLIRTQRSPCGTDLLGLIESQLSLCKCIVKLRTMSYSNGKQLVRSGICSWQDRWMKVALCSECDQPPPKLIKNLPTDFNSAWLMERKHNHHE